MRDVRGMTILEVVIVLALMGILLIVTLPLVQTYIALRHVKQIARYISGDIRLTQQRAITGDENYRLRLVTGPKYQVQRVSDGLVIRDVDIPTDVTVTSNLTSDTIVFASTGAPTASGVFCVTNGVQILEVQVQAATGRTAILTVTVCP